MASREILYKYGLPTAQEFLDNQPEKQTWKVVVRRNANEHLKKEIIQEAEKINTEIPK